MYSMSALGPAMGFLLSAFLLGYYVDIDKSDVDFDKYKDLNSESASWVGAWWLGLLVCGALALLVAVPLLLFPTSIPGKQRNHHSDNRPPSDMAFVKNFKGTSAMCVSFCPLFRFTASSLHVSGYNLRADFQCCTLVPPLNSGPNAAPASGQALSVQCHCQCRHWCWPWLP